MIGIKMQGTLVHNDWNKNARYIGKVKYGKMNLRKIDRIQATGKII
jgi:hypothetical protein